MEDFLVLHSLCRRSLQQQAAAADKSIRRPMLDAAAEFLAKLGLFARLHLLSLGHAQWQTWLLHLKAHVVPWCIVNNLDNSEFKVMTDLENNAITSNNIELIGAK
jgi:hypothetical protein